MKVGAFKREKKAPSSDKESSTLESCKPKNLIGFYGPTRIKSNCSTADQLSYPLEEYIVSLELLLVSQYSLRNSLRLYFSEHLTFIVLRIGSEVCLFLIQGIILCVMESYSTICFVRVGGVQEEGNYFYCKIFRIAFYTGKPFK